VLLAVAGLLAFYYQIEWLYLVLAVLFLSLFIAEGPQKEPVLVMAQSPQQMMGGNQPVVITQGAQGSKAWSTATSMIGSYIQNIITQKK